MTQPPDTDDSRRDEMAEALQANNPHVSPCYAFKAGWAARDEEVTQLKGALGLKDDDYVQQVGTWKIIQRLEEQVMNLEAENKRFIEKYDLQLLVQREKMLRAALESVLKDSENGFARAVAREALKSGGGE